MKIKPSARSHTPPATYKRRKPEYVTPKSGHWYLVVCNVNAEKKAQLALGGNVCPDHDEEMADNARRKVAHGLSGVFHTYLPIECKIQPTGGRRPNKAVVERPLLSRYLFVASVEEAFPFFKLKGVTGVESIVRVEGRPMPIPHGVVAAIMRRDREGEFVGPGVERDLTLADFGLSTGQKVTIDNPSGQPLIAVIQSLMPRNHAKVMMELFGRLVPVTVSLEQIAEVA